MPRFIKMDSYRQTRKTNRNRIEERRGPLYVRIFRPFLKSSGYSFVESIIVSAILLASMLLVFQMLNHFNIWWRMQEDHQEKTASARYFIDELSNLLYMAGYKSSVTGIHHIGKDLLSFEFLVEGAEQIQDQYTRHRLYTVYQDGEKVKLRIQRRLLPLDGYPKWSTGSTTVLTESVKELSFRYLDSNGIETQDPDSVRLVNFTLKLDSPAFSNTNSPGDHCYRSSVYLRNFRG